MENIILKSGTLTVCIFAGSRNGQGGGFAAEAVILGKSLANSGIKVIFGGGGEGIMGSIAEGVRQGSGYILGVMPEFLSERERLNQNLAELIITKSMHERKSTMYEKSSAYIVMPGGLGTLEEVCEILTWKQLGLHSKPVIFMNINNFWTPFFDFLNHLSRNGFLNKKTLSIFKVAHNTQEILSILLDSKRSVS